MSQDIEQLQPSCPKCHRRHRPDLPCWTGKYRRQVTALRLRQDGTGECWLKLPGICTGKATTIDHTPIARSHGGDDTPENTKPACGPCNSARGNRRRLPEEPETRPAGVGLSPRWRRSS